jgi:hypothetical protein
MVHIRDILTQPFMSSLTNWCFLVVRLISRRTLVAGSDCPYPVWANVPGDALLLVILECCVELGPEMGPSTTGWKNCRKNFHDKGAGMMRKGRSRGGLLRRCGLCNTPGFYYAWRCYHTMSITLIVGKTLISGSTSFVYKGNRVKKFRKYLINNSNIAHNN